MVNGVSNRIDAQMPVLKDEFQPRIAHQHAKRKAGLPRDLETVADAEHPVAAPARSPCTASITGARAAIAPQRK